MSEGFGNAAFVEELLPILEELATYGPRALVGALLNEVEEAHTIIADKSPGCIVWSNRVVKAAQDYTQDKPGAYYRLQTTVEALTPKLNGYVNPGGRDEAIWQYERACVNLGEAVANEPDADEAKAALQHLVSFYGLWLGEETTARADARAKQLSQLRAYIDAAKRNARLNLSRDRISGLAD